jgi:hypothetical protein
MLAVIGAIAGMVMLLYRNLNETQKIAEVSCFSFHYGLAVFFLTGFDPTTIRKGASLPLRAKRNRAEVFQSFNPLFIVTYLSCMAVFHHDEKG